MNLNSFMKRYCSLLSTAIFFLATSTQADIPAFVLRDVSTNPPLSFTGTRGWQFERGGTPNDILITQLGVFDSSGDGLSNPHDIGLWRRNPDNLSGTLLASATVPAGTEAPLIGGYRWVTISPVAIPHTLGFYVVGAQYSAGDADALGPWSAYQIARDIVISSLGIGGLKSLGPDFSFPANVVQGPCVGCPGPVFWEPNLQYTVVPEGSVWLLLSPALLYVLLRCRRCR